MLVLPHDIALSIEIDGPLNALGLLTCSFACSLSSGLRFALLRASGYRVGASEFVSVSHTPKNRLITATRQRRTGRAEPRSAGRARAEAAEEYRALVDATGGETIALALLLGHDSREGA